jgi:(1->4)-alpha-D-glucan 1-alpha-D-glucosylmutase
MLHWLSHGVLDGLRVDHPDGLRDPQQYFDRLASAAPRAWIIAEKILMPHERLPESWPIAGTTGYDFLNQVLRLFIDPRGEAPLTEFYAEFTGESTDYPALAREKKHLVMRDLFASDLNRLTVQLADVCENSPRYRDYTRRDLNSMLREVIVCLSVYRTYVQANENRINETDRRYINEAIDAAKANRPDLDAELFDFFRRIMLLEVRGPLEAELVMRFQQSTGPVMAKGIEDTLFYNYNRFVALNDVGSEPNKFATAPDHFHRWNQETLAKHPHTMLTTTTHDTKRGEDVRMRLALLSEMPQRWATTVRAWSQKNDHHRTQFKPDRNLEYFYYQTLVGAWPIDVRRMRSYLLKAAREAKQHTSWTTPNDDYEAALKKFVEGTMEDNQFLTSVEAFSKELQQWGRVNSLAQTLLKLTVPGVPDIYQGSDLWDLRLVDPDNRTAVDFSVRREMLGQLNDLKAENVLERWDEGVPKLWTIHRALSVRKAHPEIFDSGSYEPLMATGPMAQHAMGFVRGGAIVTIVPRLVLTLADNWNNTSLEIPAGKWQNALTGETVSGGCRDLAELLKQFPVALLVQGDIADRPVF